MQKSFIKNIQTITKKTLQKKLSTSHHQRLSQVYDFAAKNLGEIKRRTGESYFQHGCEVAMTIQEVTTDPSMIAVAICHDLLVHPDGKQLLKDSPLMPKERKLVRGMYALRRLHIDEETKDLDFLIQKFTQDGTLVLLRMAHRLNDVRNISRFKGRLKKDLSRETLHMYTAIAGRLSLHRWRREMEDVCFQVMHPKSFNHIEALYNSHHQIDQASLKHTKKFLSETFKKQNVRLRLESRIKSYYSTYRKMVLKNRTFDELTDRLAIRVIVNDLKDCYSALGVIHQSMHPIPGKLKDYIGAPKENGYRSIHTVVYPLPGVTEQPIEIQIRTEEMHRECEFGVASHTQYKIWKYVLKKPESRVNIFRNLEQLRQEVRSPHQFEKVLRTYFRSDHLILFDHLNNLFYLKKPSTVLDFATMAYGKRCKRIKTIRVNGKIEPLDTTLHNGDVIEIRFGKANTLKKHWVKFCHHKSSGELIKKLASAE